MDVVYIVRAGDGNQELRHSLRSLRNAPHDTVWIVGHTPQWVTGVESVQTIQGGTKNENSTRNVLTACNVSGISDPFVLMMDDIFIVDPIKAFPIQHRGRMDDVLKAYELKYRTGRSNYIHGMRETYEWLRRHGYPDPVSYELHTPLIVHKAGMVRAIQAGIGAGISVPHKRTLYGNLEGIGGTKTADVKIYDRRERTGYPRPFVSSCDMSFNGGWIGREIRRLFPEPCQYERPSATREIRLRPAKPVRVGITPPTRPEAAYGDPVAP